MIIAVDAMGGDHAPGEIVRGAAEGSKLHGVDVILVGDEGKIRPHLTGLDCPGVSVLHTSDAIGMDEHVEAIRTRRDASVVVAGLLVREGKADAMVSVGNTAAAMAVASLHVGRISDIDKPALAAVYPNGGNGTVLLDVGAVVDCTVPFLKQFAIMGGVYAEKVLAISNPRVGLLSVGGEKGKGREVVRAAYQEFETLPINFIGNVEANNLFDGTVDVIVTDGSEGNTALKTAEGTAEYIMREIMDEVKANLPENIPVEAITSFLGGVRKRLDYSEHGGVPLLGINGVCIIGHGRSKARAVASAVRSAKTAVESGLVGAITEAFTL